MPQHTMSDARFGAVELGSGILVKQLATRLLQFNREDLYAELTEAWAGARADVAFPTPHLVEDEIPTMGDRATVQKYEDEIGSDPTPPVAFHLDGGDRLAVHGKSATGFRGGLPGHGFTGLVRIGTGELHAGGKARTLATAIREGYRTKIFLFPLDPDEKYPIRRWEDGTAGQVYGYEHAPIVHGADGSPSHRHLTDFIRQKDDWRPLKQKKGLLLGFTVLKGGATTPNRYTFTSMSSNQAAFAVHEKVPGRPWMQIARPGLQGVVTRPWANAIRRTIDHL